MDRVRVVKPALLWMTVAVAVSTVMSVTWVVGVVVALIHRGFRGSVVVSQRASNEPSHRARSQRRNTTTTTITNTTCRRCETVSVDVDVVAIVVVVYAHES